MTCAPFNFFFWGGEGGGGRLQVNYKGGGRTVGQKILILSEVALSGGRGRLILLGDVFNIHKKLLKVVLNKHIIEYFKDHILVKKSCRK